MEQYVLGTLLADLCEIVGGDLQLGMRFELSAGKMFVSTDDIGRFPDRPRIRDGDFVTVEKRQ